MSMLCDESTDIANTARMTLNARIIKPGSGEAKSVFLQDIEYEDGSGLGLHGELVKVLQKREIPVEKVVGLGTDGASVMTGLNKGVHGRRKELNPHIMNIHCLAHRLALCTSQAASGIPLLKKYQEWLTQLSDSAYFKRSPQREKQLHKIQDILNHPKLKYREVHAVRWLSFYEALEAVYRTIDPLLTYLHSRTAHKDPIAKGLLKYMATTQFIFITYLMMDVIPKLCLNFQSDSLDVAKAMVSLDLCIADLEAYKQGSTQIETHVERYESVVKRTEDGHYEYSGHRLQATSTNLTALKSTFVNKLISNIKSRFPEKGILDAFYILSMRTIRFESDINSYGVEEMETLLHFYGEKQTHKDSHYDPIVNKDLIRVQWLQAKMIVKAAMYPVDNMANLWSLLIQHHADDIPDLIKLAQIALVLPLHTAGCEWVFSQQNIVVSKLRNRLSPLHCERLLRVRLEGKGLKDHNFEESLRKFHDKKRLIKTSVK